MESTPAPPQASASNAPDPGVGCAVFFTHTPGKDLHAAQGSEGHRHRRRRRDGRATSRRGSRKAGAQVAAGDVNEAGPRGAARRRSTGASSTSPNEKDCGVVRRLGRRADGRAQRARQQRRDHPRRAPREEGPGHRRDHEALARPVERRHRREPDRRDAHGARGRARRWSTTGQRPGVIVNMSSIARHGNRGQSNYVAAKAALAANTVTWAREFAAFGIRVGASRPA